MELSPEYLNRMVSKLSIKKDVMSDADYMNYISGIQLKNNKEYKSCDLCYTVKEKKDINYKGLCKECFESIDNDINVDVVKNDLNKILNNKNILKKKNSQKIKKMKIIKEKIYRKKGRPAYTKGENLLRLPERKICSKCGEEKHISEYYLIKNNTVKPSCKNCISLTNKNWKNRNKEKVSSYLREYHKTYVRKNK